MAADSALKREAVIPLKLVALFLIFAAGFLVAGYFSFRGYEQRFRAEVESELSAIAELKVAELVQWRSERIGNAEVLFNSASFADLTRRYLQEPRNREVKRLLREWLAQYPQHYDYDQIRLFDPRGVTRMSIPPNRPPASGAVLKRFAEVLSSRRITIVDLYRHDHDQRIYLSVLIPILDRQADNRIVGIISLRIDPDKYLYQLILRWPTPSRTAETLLVRRDGNDVLYLNDLRFQKNTALTHRYPLARLDKPAVQAVLGRTGIVEGVNYRGEPVVADARSVPGSPWFLLTRMNLSEVVAPARRYLWMTLALVTAMLFGTGFGLAFIWRRQRLRFYREQYRTSEALRESQELFALFMRNSPIYTYIKEVTPTESRVLQASENFHQMIGIRGSVMTGRTMTELFPPEFAAKMTADDWAVVSGGEILKLDEELNGRIYTTIKFPLAQGARTLLAGYTIDITDRKQAEAELVRSLKEKEVLLKEIHHRVKNNMQVVSSLLNLQAKGVADPAIRAVFEDARNRVNSMALIHQKLYQSHDLAHISFNEYLQSLVAGIADTYQRHDVVFDLGSESVALDVNVGIPCGLIVNELVSNCLKYAFPEGGKGIVKVGISRDHEGNNVLTVADNGIGFPDTMDFRNTKSLGLQLVNVLAGQIRGTIALSNSGGTKFSITFPGTMKNE